MNTVTRGVVKDVVRNPLCSRAVLGIHTMLKVICYIAVVVDQTPVNLRVSCLAKKPDTLPVHVVDDAVNQLDVIRGFEENAIRAIPGVLSVSGAGGKRLRYLQTLEVRLLPLDTRPSTKGLAICF